VDDPEHAPPVSRDPNDDYLIATALHAKADVLVSGDRDLTDLLDPPVRILTHAACSTNSPHRRTRSRSNRRDSTHAPTPTVTPDAAQRPLLPRAHR
jgi:hypothetical protein